MMPLTVTLWPFLTPQILNTVMEPLLLAFVLVKQSKLHLFCGKIVVVAAQSEEHSFLTNNKHPQEIDR